MKKLIKKSKIIISLSLAVFVAISSMVPLANASGNVAFESTLNVANVTAGDTSYKPSVNAKVDDVVKLEVYYHNKEAENSGIQAKNVNVKVSVPGDTSKSHVFTSTVTGSNIDTFTRNATVNTEINTGLSYIPGSAFRRHNAGTNANQNWVTEKLPDTVVTTGYTIPSMNPCFNFQETITILARVKAPVVSIVKKVKVDGDSEFKTDINAKPGDTLVFSIGFKNEGNVMLNDVVIRDSFPIGLEYLKGSAQIINSTFPNGAPISDKVIDSGSIVGDYGPGINGIVRLKAKVPTNITPGCHRYMNVGIVKAKEIGEYYNTATVNVCVNAPTPPTVTPKTTPVVTTTQITPEVPTSLPEAGPTEAAAGIMGGISLAGATVYYRKSKDLLKKSFRLIK